MEVERVDWTTRHRQAVAAVLSDLDPAQHGSFLYRQEKYLRDAAFHAEVYEAASRRLEREDRARKEGSGSHG
jgi:hypothetical protein